MKKIKTTEREITRVDLIYTKGNQKKSKTYKSLKK